MKALYVLHLRVFHLRKYVQRIKRGCEGCTYVTHQRVSKVMVYMDRIEVMKNPRVLHLRMFLTKESAYKEGRS